MPTQARVEIRHNRLMVDGVDLTHQVSDSNFHIDRDNGRWVVTLELLPTTDLTVDVPDAILRLAGSDGESDAAEQPHRCALLVALNEDDANYWRHAGGTRRMALTHGTSPLRSVEGLRVTDVYITPRAAEGERYERVMDTVRQSLRLMGADPSAAINYLGDQREA